MLSKKESFPKISLNDEESKVFSIVRDKVEGIIKRTKQYSDEYSEGDWTLVTQNKGMIISASVATIAASALLVHARRTQLTNREDTATNSTYNLAQVEEFALTLQETADAALGSDD